MIPQKARLQFLQFARQTSLFRIKNAAHRCIPACNSRSPSYSHITVARPYSKTSCFAQSAHQPQQNQCLSNETAASDSGTRANNEQEGAKAEGEQFELGMEYMEQIEDMIRKELDNFISLGNFYFEPILKRGAILDDRIRVTELNTVASRRLHFLKMIAKLHIKYSFVKYEITGSAINLEERKISLIWRQGTSKNWLRIPSFFSAFNLLRNEPTKPPSRTTIQISDEFVEAHVAEDGFVDRIVFRPVTKADFLLIEKAERAKEEARIKQTELKKEEETRKTEANPGNSQAP